MKTRTLIKPLTALALSLALASTALAGGGYGHGKGHGYGHGNKHHDYARVINVEPIYEHRAYRVPQESCHYENRAYHSRGGSYTGTLAGGILGTMIGHRLGHGDGDKELAAVAGGLLGASIGHDISRRNRPGEVHYGKERVCHTSYHKDYHREVVGYKVAYKYNGRVHYTRTQHHPGRHIPVDVEVHPRYRY